MPVGIGSPEAIREAIDQAGDALKDGRVQDARHILEALGSEIVISVTNLPLATYPDAIRAITPLIDEGKIEEAKRALQAALNTLVVTEHVVPLPVLRAQEMLARAEELVAKDERSEEESESLHDTLSAARNQLEMAELLGYGKQREYEELYAKLEEIEQVTTEGRSGKAFFESLRNSLSELWSSIAS